MKTLFLILALSTSSFAQCLEMDIMLVGDFSFSVQGNEKFVVDAIQSFSDRFKLSETGVNIGIVTFNSDVYLTSPLSQDNADINRSIESLRSVACSGTTNMTEALQVAANELTKGRSGVMKSIILISDGRPNSPSSTIQTADMIKNLMRYTICTVLIDMDDSDEGVLIGISSNCYVSTNFNSLSDELKKLDVCL